MNSYTFSHRYRSPIAIRAQLTAVETSYCLFGRATLVKNYNNVIFVYAT